MDGVGIESQWGGEIFRIHPDWPWAHTGPTQPHTQGVLGLFHWGKVAGGVALTTHIHLVPRLRTE
jgi:hypothetical protein